MYNTRAEIFHKILQKLDVVVKTQFVEINWAVRKGCVWWSSKSGGKNNTRSQLESTCSRIWPWSWDVVSIPTVICMWNMEPYSPWKDGLWSWFRKWFNPGLGVLPRTAGFHRALWSKHTWNRGLWQRPECSIYEEIFVFPCSHLCFNIVLLIFLLYLLLILLLWLSVSVSSI